MERYMKSSVDELKKYVREKMPNTKQVYKMKKYDLISLLIKHDEQIAKSQSSKTYIGAVPKKRLNRSQF